MKGTKLGALSPVGFPTLKALKATARLAPIGVNVFGMTSRRDSVVLAFQDLKPGGEGLPRAPGAPPGAGRPGPPAHSHAPPNAPPIAR